MLCRGPGADPCCELRRVLPRPPEKHVIATGPISPRRLRHRFPTRATPPCPTTQEGTTHMDRLRLLTAKLTAEPSTENASPKHSQQLTAHDSDKGVRSRRDLLHMTTTKRQACATRRGANVARMNRHQLELTGQSNSAL